MASITADSTTARSGPPDEDAIVTATTDLDACESPRRDMVLFRDRRVDLYGAS